MPAAEFDLWCGFAMVEPFGPRQEELRAGTVAAVAGSAWGGKLQPEDLFPSLANEQQGGLDTWRAWAVANCPALTVVRPDAAQSRGRPVRHGRRS